MSKFNRKTYTAPDSAVHTTGPGLTHEGGKGYTLDARGELFFLTTAAFPAEDAFYEKADDRLNRFIKLVRQAAVHDFTWLRDMLLWARTEGYMRTAPIIATAEAALARVEVGIHGETRKLVAEVPQRADEPGEMLGWIQHRYGNKGVRKALKLNMPLRRGLGDACARLYNEKSYIKWDSDRRGFRFGDVLQLVKPKRAAGSTTDHLLTYIVDERKGKNPEIPEDLTVLSSRASLMSMPVGQRRAFILEGGNPRLSRAGVTWEALSGWLQGPMDKEAWEAIIPSMGCMALIRNLRNFDQAGVSNAVAKKICAKISDPEEVKAAKLMPVRMLSAYRQAPSLRWASALDEAMTASLENIPALPGHTLVLADTSASMSSPVSARSSVTMTDHAALFGCALALKGAAVDLVLFATNSMTHAVRKGGSVLSEMDRIKDQQSRVGFGTNMGPAIRKHYAQHDRVVILSDMQTFADRDYWGCGRDVDASVPNKVPVYAFNLAGYAVTAIASDGTSNRHQLGGFTDKTFSMINQIETLRQGTWPWEK